MSIETTPIYDEVNKVLAGNESATFDWSCEFIVGKEKLVPFRIISIDHVCDYNGNYGDDIQISVLIPEGQFNKVIVPNLPTLEVALKRTPTFVGDATSDSEKNIEVQRYRGFFKEEPTSYIKGGTPDNIDSEGADLSGFKTVQFQLMDMAFEQLRGRSVGGIFKDLTAADVLRLIIGSESKKVDVPSESAIKGVSMVPPSNTQVRDHVIIKPMALLDLPVHLQTREGGIYSAGMGFYLQRGMWYIYPEYDTTRFKKELKTLTVIIVPPNKFPSVERTFRTTANQVIVLVTGGLIHTDDSDELQLNLGNGVRFTDANNIIDGYGKYVDGKYTVNRASNNSEFRAFVRPTGINKVMVSDNAITSNAFNEYSKLARRNCGHAMFVWENSNLSLLYPGMPCKLIYEDNGEVKEIEGVVNKAHHFTTGQGSSMIDGRYATKSTVTVLLANPDLVEVKK